MALLSRRFRLSRKSRWPGPRSLATTCGVSVDVLSYGYLDVSVPRVRHLTLCIQIKLPDLDTWKPKQFQHKDPTKAKPSQGRPAVAPDGARRRRASPPKADGTAREPKLI